MNFMSSILFAATITGFLLRCKIFTTSRSPLVIPTLPSVTKTITSASSIANCACALISSIKGTFLSSIPPVSINENS